MIIRLLLVWPFLSILIGAIVYVIELRRVDDLVKDLAVSESRPFTYDNVDYLNSDEPAHRLLLRERNEEHIRMGHFIAVALYNRARQKVNEVIRPGFDKDLIGWHKQDLIAADGMQYKSFYLDRKISVHVLVPLINGSEEIVGYFEGVYLTDRETMSAIQARTTASLVQVVVIILATAITLYPIIMALNKDLLRLSVDLSQANIGMLKVLGSAVAKRDSDTNAHNYRVTLYAIRFAEAIGLGADSIRSLIKGAFLHDVGKIGVSDTILLKPGKLNGKEFAIMKTHPRHGEDIIGRYAWLKDALSVVRYHHEKFDGSGYGAGLKGEDIPLQARLFAIVDVFDALTSRRPYKEPLPFVAAMRIIRQESGAHFDPRLINIFEGIAWDLFEKIGSVADAAVEMELDALVEKYFNTSKTDNVQYDQFRKNL